MYVRVSLTIVMIHTNYTVMCTHEFYINFMCKLPIYNYTSILVFQDIAILTNDVMRCPYYQENSQNVQSRFACVLPEEVINSMRNTNIRSRYVIPITAEECVSSSLSL